MKKKKKKNPHGRILRGEPMEQYLSTVPKSCPYMNTISSGVKNLG